MSAGVRRGVFGAAVCLALAAGATAHAQGQGPAQAGDVRAAAAEFQRGVRLLDQRRFADAAEAFERSLRIRESASVLYNLGLARRGEGSPRRALAAFERFLAVARPDNPARRGAAAMLPELRRSLAHARVEARGRSAEVRVDGERVAEADGRYEVDLDPGPHVFEARRPGYEPAREERTAARGEALDVALDASARPLPARLVVAVDDPAAAVRVDGEERARGRFEGELAPGPHRVEVLRGSSVVWSREASLLPGADERWPVAVPAPVAGPEHPVGTRRPLYRNGWFWAGVGAGVAVVAGAIVTGVLLDRAGTPPAYDGGSWNDVIQGATLAP